MSPDWHPRSYHLPGKHDQDKHGRDHGVGHKPVSGPQPGGKAFLTAHYGAWKEGLTPAQEKGLSFYQSPGYRLRDRLRESLTSRFPSGSSRAPLAGATAPRR